MLSLNDLNYKNLLSPFETELEYHSQQQLFETDLNLC